MTVSAFPLCWPAGWPRTDRMNRTDGRFNKKERQYSSSGGGSWMRTKDMTVSEALRRIQHELDAIENTSRYRKRIDFDQTVVSTNLQTRLDGLPRSGQAKPADPGVCLYFNLDGKPQCIPCDSYTTVEQNLAAVAATLSAIRTLERHGSGLMERAFTGFTALPDQTSGAWWAVLGVSPDASPSEVDAAYKIKRRDAHPDKGGSNDEFSRVTEAWGQYQQSRERAA